MMKPPDLRFRKGIEEFNSGEYFKAHETWEGLWHETTGPEKEALQSFIQIAVAIHHLKNGNGNGARYLYSRLSKKLTRSGSYFWGVDITALLVDINRCFVEPLLFRAELAPLIHQR